MAKLREMKNVKGDFTGYGHYCPGCDMLHIFDSRWSFNGDMDKPTFSPSMLVQYTWGPENEKKRCHYFLRAGQLQFLSDCTHHLVGQTVELPDYE